MYDEDLDEEDCNICTECGLFIIEEEITDQEDICLSCLIDQKEENESKKSKKN